MLKPRNIQQQGKIIIPENAEGAVKPQFYGEVISLGEKVEGIEVGDVLVFHANAGQDMVLDNYICKTVMYDEVYGIESRKVDKKEETPEDHFWTVMPQEKSNIVTPPAGAWADGVKKIN